MARLQPRSIAGLIFLALVIADLAVLAGVATQQIEIDLTLGPFEYAESLLATALGVGAAMGLFARRRWGWWFGLGNVALALISSAVALPFDPDFDPASIAATGVVWLVGAALLALLDSSRLRDTLSPNPPSSGFLARLPAAQCANIGCLLVVLGLALSLVWGWLVLVLWLTLFGVRRMRARARPSGDLVS
jgi:hypothetical protein